MDRKKRRRDHSSSDYSHHRGHRRSDRDRRSGRDEDEHRGSSSPDTSRHKHSRRHKDRRERRDESSNQSGNHSRFDPHRQIKQEPTDSFQEQQRERRLNNDRRREVRRQRELENGGINFGQEPATEDAASSAVEKEKPNFELSGKLTEDTNTYRGVVIKYNEPAEARKPKRRWRLYGFKGEESLPMLPLHRQSAFLFGRDRRVADIPVDHPSCSKQHAVLQYRLKEHTRADGSLGRSVRPYIIDLGSANGTFVNNERIDAQRYVELFERDLIKFGYSSREYVLLHENADTSEVAQDSDSG